MFRKLIYLISSVVMLGLVGNVFAQEPARDFDIPYASEPPVLDGEVDGVWGAASKQSISVFIQGDPAASISDCSGTWQVMWDQEYLYVIIEIFDDSLHNDSVNQHLDDSVEFYFDGGNSKDVYPGAGNLTVYDNNRQTTFGWNSDQITGSNSNTEGVEHAQVTTPTGWRIEMKLPWLSLQDTGPQLGGLIGVDCGLNDDDDGGDTRETQMATYGIDNNYWRDPSQWGTAMLVMGARKIAYAPSPANGSVHLKTWAQLAWQPSPVAASHNVYIGDNFDDVNAGTGDTFWVNQTATTLLIGFPGYAYPDGLVPGTTYYWRIDEVNDADPDSPWKGDVWSFSIPPKTAYNPDPADGADFVALDAILNWTAGFEAKLHTIYFGEDFDDVNSATSGGAMVPVPPYNPGALESGKAYYWRVDETDPPSTHKGQVWSFTTLGAVGNPYPSNGTGSAEMNAILTWTPADNAASHQIYFGMDKEAVRKADTTSPEYKDTKTLGAESYNPGLLAWDSTYYWRVDKVDNVNPGSLWTGPLWSFTTGDFIIVDNFESYNDIDPPQAGSNTIYFSWLDGYGTATNGALTANELPPYAEQIVVHGGEQSMSYRYDTSFNICESTLTLVSLRDWTAQGVTDLSLWFAGKPSNAAERMYVVLNGTAVVYHDNPNATQIDEWTEWVIPLQAFADQGVNPANVTSMTIGFGTRGSTTTPGGAGQMYFDDIRLYRPTVLASPPEAE